jgi:hypothetical protein
MVAAYKINLGTVGANGADGDSNRTANGKINGLLYAGVVYASQICKCDSNLSTGGGTDDTAAIQTAIDAAAGGHFIQDGVSLISDALVNGTTQTAAIMIPANTRITFLPGCGWYLANGSNCVVMSNASLTGTIGATPDQNILIEAHGIAINSNNANQNFYERGVNTNSPLMGIWFGNVQNLTIRGLTIQDSKTYCFVISNTPTAANIRLYDCRAYWSNPNESVQEDSLHMYGPLDDLETWNFRGNGGDDMLAHNTNEGPDIIVKLGFTGFGAARFPQSGNANITNVTHYRPFFDSAWAGIRIYGVTDVSGSSPSADNIKFIGARGSIGKAGQSIGAMQLGQGLTLGRITFEDWRVTEVNNNTGITFLAGTSAAMLRLEAIDPATTVSVAGMYTLSSGDYFTSTANVQTVVADGTQASYTFTIPAGFTQIAVKVNGRGSNSANGGVFVRLNGDSGNNYQWAVSQEKAGTFTYADSGSTSNVVIGIIPGTANLATYAGEIDAKISNNANFYKTIIGNYGLIDDPSSVATGQTIGQTKGDWKNVAAITSLTVALTPGNFVTGTEIVVAVIP